MVVHILTETASSKCFFFFSDLSENVIPLASLLSFWLLSTLHIQFRSLKTWNSMKKIQKNIITPFSVFPIGCSEMDSANSSPAQKLPLQWTDRTEPGINLKNTENLTRYPTIFANSHYKHTDRHFQCNEAEKKKIRTHGKTYEQLGKP